jgi:hypothetical protein
MVDRKQITLIPKRKVPYIEGAENVTEQIINYVDSAVETVVPSVGGCNCPYFHVIPVGTDKYQLRDDRIAYWETMVTYGRGSVYAYESHAQTFTAAINSALSSISLVLYRQGSPGTLTVRLYATSGGKPTGSALSTGTTDGDTLTTDVYGEWRTVTMSAYTLTAGTTYAITLQAEIYS